MVKTPLVVLVLCVFFGTMALSRCSVNTEDKKVEEAVPAGPYLNHHDTVKYVGMNTCKGCHADKHSTFVHTGMGLSFDTASPSKSAASFSRHKAVYDAKSDYYYYPYFSKGEMWLLEYRLRGRDTVHKRAEKIDYIVGSGQHTNSHIINRNGFLFQAPITWYAQQKRWDLPPGFENGNNSRFSRIIGMECMSCHNALPGFVKGSENRFTRIPDGIDCERCHGPGELHVQEKRAGKLVDVSKETDYTIVNPGKLSWELQIDLCQRCHLQGNAVLKEGKDFADFRPGMRLTEVMDVFMPKYKGGEEEFIMASHAERFRMSKCFIASNKEYEKNPQTTQLNFTCITCHNPHVSVKVTGRQVFNNACNNCHAGKQECSEQPKLLKAANYDCVKCHIPSSGTIDIPHVSVHDHYIRKPQKTEAKKGIKEFAGLYAVNTPDTDPLTKAKAYLAYFEKFDRGNTLHLDSAAAYLSLAGNPLKERIHLYYLKGDYAAIGQLQGKENTGSITDGWTQYRVARSLQQLGSFAEADRYYQSAVQLQPYNLDFKTEWAALKIELDQQATAKKLLEEVLRSYSQHVSALTNLGFVYFLEGNIRQAKEYYEKALQLDPDYPQALLNMAGLYNYLGEKEKARKIVTDLLKINPANQLARKILQNIH